MMKIVFVGGGAHRYLGIARSLLAVPGLMDQGEINLYDLAVDRAAAVGRMVMKAPEYAQADCRISWGTSLEQALEGADLVYVVLMAGSRRNFSRLQNSCAQYGFLGSDQLSPSGAILGLKGGPILMDLARKMEKLCPQAWLIDFANPVAVLSAAVNNHTRIRCLGVCAGYTNHQWDLTRLLYGKDEQWDDYKIRCAGVNHMSFILPGSRHRDCDLYEKAAEVLTDDWQAPVLTDRWGEQARLAIPKGLALLVKFYKKYGYLVFSSEQDGIAHLDMEGTYLRLVHEEAARPLDLSALEAADQQQRAERTRADQRFQAWLDKDMTEKEWNTARPDALYLLRADEDIMTRIARAVGGVEDMAIATSRPNLGAVSGFKDRVVLEYSQVLGSKGLQPSEGLEVPDVFQGLVSSLATHQTLLGDAIATGDPRILFHALYLYPVKQDTTEAKAMWRALLEMAADEIPAVFQNTRDMFLY